MKQISWKYFIMAVLLFIGIWGHFTVVQAAANQLEIILNPDGGTCHTQRLVYVYEDGQSPLIGQLPVCEKPQYSFLGWKDEKGYIITANTNILEINGTTLKAYYTITQKTITFNANGGTVPIESKIVDYNSQIGTLPIPAKKDSIFLGWFTQVDGGVLVEENTVYGYQTNITIFAHWSTEMADPEMTTDQGNKKNTGKIKIAWGRVAGATGYQIQYSNEKKFQKSKTKTIKVKGGKKKSYTIKKLKKGKRYFIRMRAYQTRKQKKTLYSAWSKTVRKKAK